MKTLNYSILGFISFMIITVNTNAQTSPNGGNGSSGTVKSSSHGNPAPIQSSVNSKTGNISNSNATGTKLQPPVGNIDQNSSSVTNPTTTSPQTTGGGTGTGPNGTSANGASSAGNQDNTTPSTGTTETAATTSDKAANSSTGASKTEADDTGSKEDHNNNYGWLGLLGLLGLAGLIKRKDKVRETRLQ